MSLSLRLSLSCTEITNCTEITGYFGTTKPGYFSTISAIFTQMSRLDTMCEIAVSLISLLLEGLFIIINASLQQPTTKLSSKNLINFEAQKITFDYEKKLSAIKYYFHHVSVSKLVTHIVYQQRTSIKIIRVEYGGRWRHTFVGYFSTWLFRYRSPPKSYYNQYCQF